MPFSVFGVDQAMSATPMRPHGATRANLSPNHLRDILEGISFLEVLKEAQLARLARQSYVRLYEPGDVVVRQGDYGHSMFVLIEGSLRVETVNDNGTSQVLAKIQNQGSCIGEIALLGRSRRTASVVAETHAVMMEVEKTVVEKANKQSQGKVFKALQETTRKRSIISFLGQHRYFNELNAQAMDFLATHATLKVAERGSTIFQAADRDDTVLMMKTSVAKLVRINPAKGDTGETESILSYFNAGDVIGLKHHGQRGANLISMGYVELIEIPRSYFYNLLKNDYPALYQKLQEEEDTRIKGLSEHVMTRGKTVAIFVQALMNEGAQEGQSLLTINLNKCIRCGNCVQSCQSRHGYARVARRGKKLVRRAKVEKAGSYETILLPASCRHCVNPECMIGCPTGAIHRTPSGEVDIHPTCIGCASCANRCPWGNISIIDTPGRQVYDPISEKDVIRDRLASKCNLCHGYDNANCVHNCPTGAILRVEPTQYWEEIAEVFKDANRTGVGHTDQVPKSNLTHIAMGGGFAIVAILLSALKVWEYSTTGHMGYSVPMLTLGVATTFFMLASTALAARRRMNRFRIQGGTFLTWTRGHFYLGTMALFAMLLHAGFRLGGTLTSTLFLLTLSMIFTGLVGAAYYKWLPKTITRIEGGGQVEEDLLQEQKEIQTRTHELLQGLSPQANALANTTQSSGGSLWKRFGSSYKPEEQSVQKAAKTRLQNQLGELASAEKQILERLIDDASRTVDIKAALLLYRIRRAGLVTHISIATLVLLMMIVHIISVVFFWPVS